MLKDLQALAQVRPGRRASGGVSAYSNEWLSRERGLLSELTERCGAYLQCSRSSPPTDLETLCDRLVSGFQEALRREIADFPRANGSEAVAQLCSDYCQRVRGEHRRLFDDALIHYLHSASEGNSIALSELSEAAGVPGEVLVLLEKEDRSTPLSKRSGATNRADDDPLRVAFDALHGQLEKGIRGFLRRHNIYDEDRLSEVSQDVWLAVWDNLPTYNPARASFYHFVKYWATVMIRRYQERQQRSRTTEVVASDIRVTSLDPEADETLDEVLSRLAAQELPTLDPAVYVEVYGALLQATFGSSSPPHQLVAFGFRKVGDWTPRRMVQELSDEALRSLETRLEQDYRDESQLPENLVDTCFAPLRNAMPRRFDSAVKDPKTLRTYPTLHGRIVGDSTFRDYYTGTPTADITQWWYAVQRRVLPMIQGDGALSGLFSER